MTTDGPARGVDRRHAIAGVAGLGVAAPVLVACGSKETGSQAKAGTTLGPTSDVPVGGGTIYDTEKVVVTQPTEGDFKAFTAVCTHSGCLVGRVADGTIQCPCHGSQFAIEDGSVTQGPATAPLEAVSVSVEGDSLTLT